MGNRPGWILQLPHPPKFCGKEKLSLKGDPALPARLRGRPFNGPRTRPSQGDCLKLCLPRSRASHHAVKQGQQEPSGVRVWKSRPLQWDSIYTSTLVGVVTGGATAGVRQVCRAQAKSRGPTGTGRETRVATGAQARAYLQWWARSGLMLQHLGHLYTTCPGFSCKLSMNSLVAFPLGTAPCEEEDGCQGRATAPSVLTAHSGQSFENCDYTHGMGVQDMPIPTTLASAFRMVPEPMNSYRQRIFLRK